MNKTRLILPALILGWGLAGTAQAGGGGLWFGGGDGDVHFSVTVPVGHGPHGHYGHPWRWHHRPPHLPRLRHGYRYRHGDPGHGHGHRHGHRHGY